jgi:hypothetical protein
MCSSSAEQIFAWVGAILVNAAFISIIAWGSFTTTWYIGFIISAIYTALLFVSARIVDKKSRWDAVAPINDVEEVHLADDSAEHQEAATAADTVQALREQRMPVMANFFYGLFTLAFGVTGYFLPMNILPCGYYWTSPTNNGHWITDGSSLSSDVRTWASSSQESAPPATFVQIDDNEERYTIFAGADGSDYTQTLWSITGDAESIHFPDIQNPTFFVDTNGWACFSAYNQKHFVGCSNGTKVTMTIDSTEYTFQSPYDLIVDIDDTLWFKDYPPWSGNQSGSGYLIYSISDYETMEVELHSTYSTSTDMATKELPEGSSDNDCWRKQVVLAIFVSAIPTTLSSIIIWIKRNAPAMAITSFLGISALAIFVYLAIVGETLFHFNDFWGWWLSISSAVYTIVLCDLTHCKRRIAQIPLVWGINFASLAFFVGMILLTDIFGERAWPWIVFNIFACVPLGIVGIGYRQVFLLLLCAVGWILTAVKIASALTEAFSGGAVPIYFIVLAVSGTIIAGVGWLLKKHQEKIHDVLLPRMEGLSLSRKLFPEVESQEQSTDE